jgi:ABC-type transporter Mla subunit MlaD
MDAELTAPAPLPVRRRRMAEETRHILVGAAVFLGLVGLFAFSAGSDGGTLGSYRVVAYFNTAEGVHLDSPVTISGVQVGRVSRMGFDLSPARA